MSVRTTLRHWLTRRRPARRPTPARLPVEELEPRLAPALSLTGFSANQLVNPGSAIDFTISSPYRTDVDQYVPIGTDLYSYGLWVFVSYADPARSDSSPHVVNAISRWIYPGNTPYGAQAKSPPASAVADGCLIHQSLLGQPISYHFGFADPLPFQGRQPGHAPYLWATVSYLHTRRTDVGVWTTIDRDDDYEDLILPFRVAQTTLTFSHQPESAPAGRLKGPVTVTALDANHHPVAGLPVTVTLNNARGATLRGSTTVTTDAQGLASFGDLAIDRPGQGYTLTATAADVVDLTSNPFDLNSTLTWSGGGDGASWSDPDNWETHAAPVAGDDVLFPDGAPPAPRNDIAGLTLGNIEVTGAGYTFTGLPLTLTGKLSSAAGTTTYALDTTLAGAATFQVSAGTLEIESRLTGGGSLTLAGAGRLVLDQDNTYAGPTTLQAGTTLELAADNAPGAGPLVVAAGGTVTLGAWNTDAVALGNTVQLADGAVLATDSTVRLTGPVALAGQATVQPTAAGDVLRLEGGLAGGPGTLTTGGAGTVVIPGEVPAGVTLQVPDGVLELGGALHGPAAVTGGTLRLTAGLSGTGAIDLRSGLLESAAALPGYTGTVTLEGGRAAVAADTPLGTGTLLIAPAGGSPPTLGASGAGAAVSLANPLTFRSDAGLATSGTLTLAGSVTLAGTNALRPAAGGLLEITGPIAGGG